MLMKEIEELNDLAGFALQYFDEFGVAEDDVRRRLAQLAYKAGQELHLLTTNVPDAAEHYTSFIELKCHNCGAIIDAKLTQMPRK